MDRSYSAGSPWPPMLWIAAVIFAPVSEEVFFRGFVYQGLAQSLVVVPAQAKVFL